MGMNAALFRKEVMPLIITFMDAFDPSGHSTTIWKNKLGQLSDEKFVKEVKAILDNPKRWFSPEIQSFNKKTQPKFESFQRIAKLVDVELDEYVVLPYMNENTTVTAPTITMTKVPVGPLHLKRLQQMTRKKNKLALSADKRDARNGQVRGDDKGGRVTDADLYAMLVYDLGDVVKEFYGPRADSKDAKEVLYDKIRNGERLPRLADLPNDVDEKVALNTFNFYIMGATLVSDLVSETYELPITKSEKLANKDINRRRNQMDS